jgi:uncharacterized protein
LTETSTSRRRFLKAAAAAAAMGTLAIGADATLLEPNRPRLIRVEIPLARLPQDFDRFTIVQLSDFHYDPYFSAVPIAAAVRMANDLAPDLVALTGDFVSTPVFGGTEKTIRAAWQAEPCGEILRGLRARHGVWAVLGNHDAFSNASHVEKALTGVGVGVLGNSAVPIERQGRRFWLAGIGDVLAGDADLWAALHGIPPSETVVLLAHEPDFADAVARHSVDLQLSGHSHGGQVRFPLVGAVYLPRMGRKYPKGLRRVNGLSVYTNVGIGTLGVPMRWNCPPEITLITLRSLQP